MTDGFEANYNVLLKKIITCFDRMALTSPHGVAI
jgi:hypothetical protein